MGHSAPTTASAVDPSTRFLADVENLWTLLRLYGTEHPAFVRGAETAAASVARQLRVSISPSGFAVGGATFDDPTLVVFARRLRSMGLVGIVVDPGLTPAQVTALVQALDSANRTHATGTAVVDSLAAASGRKFMAIPLRLAGLKLSEGTREESAANAQTTVWRDLFSAALYPAGGASDPAALAASFELALKGIASPEQWEAMVAVWARQLAAAEAPVPSSVRTGTAPAGAKPAGPANRDDTIDAAAAFLGALSPDLCRRLLAETFAGQVAPTSVVMALADRLPKGMILGALAAVDRGNSQPSVAALALLRKMASNLPGAGAAADASPRTTAEMVEIASSLERLLGSEKEEGFVPEAYLDQRKALSGRAVAPAAGLAVSYPSDRETSRHAAGLAFEMLGTPDTPAEDLASALGYLRNKLGEWIKASDFTLAAEALAAASAHVNHWDKEVAKPAVDLLTHAVTADDVIEGARHAPRAQAAEGAAALLAKLDGTALARTLAVLQPSAPGGHDAVLDGFRKVLPDLKDEVVRALCDSFKDTTPPPALLSVLTSLGAADAVKAVGAFIPHAGPATRRAVAHVIFRHDFRWPLPLIERLLKDDEAEIRRLAVMKAVSDAGLDAAARFFVQAMNRHGPFDADVALGLAELLHRHRGHPDVKAAYRQWLWSGRRWAALFSLSLAGGRSAA